MFFHDDIFLSLTTGNHAKKEQWFSERIFRFCVRNFGGRVFRILKTMPVNSAYIRGREIDVEQPLTKMFENIAVLCFNKGMKDYL